MRLTIPLDSFSAVGPGQTANTKIPTDNRIHALPLQTNAANATELNAMVDYVQLALGSFDLVNLTIPQLYALCAYYGIPVGAGEIPLYFSRAQVRTPTGEEFTALNTFGRSDLTLRVKFRTNAEYNALMSVGTGFVPTLKGVWEYDLVNDGNRAFIQMLQRDIGNSGAGVADFNTLERDGAYKAIHIFSNLATRVRVLRDGLELIDRTLAEVDTLNRRYGLTRQANHFPVDFGYTNQAQDLLEMERFDASGNRIYQAKTFNLKVTTSGAGTMPAVIEKAITV